MIDYIESKNLPSRGVPYLNDFRIEIESLSLGDVLHMSNENLDIVDIYNFRAKKIRPDILIDSLELTPQDFYFCCFYQDYISIEKDDFAIDFKCKNENCECYQLDKKNKEKTPEEYGIREVILKYSDINFEDFSIEKLPLNYIKDGQKFEFKPLSMRTLKILMKKNLKNDIIAKFASYLDIKLELSEDLLKKYSNLENNPDKWAEIKLEKAIELINQKFSLKEMNLFKDIDNKFNHGVTPIKVICEYCKEENRITISTAYTVIRSFRKDFGIIGDEIQFG